MARGQQRALSAGVVAAAAGLLACFADDLVGAFVTRFAAGAPNARQI